MVRIKYKVPGQNFANGYYIDGRLDIIDHHHHNGSNQQ